MYEDEGENSLMESFMEKKHLDPHEVYGGSNRKRSIRNNFIKMLCRKCHSSEEIINQLKI